MVELGGNASSVRILPAVDAPNVGLKIVAQNNATNGSAKGLLLDLTAQNQNDFGILIQHHNPGPTSGWDAFRIADNTSSETDLRVVQDGGMTLGDPSGSSKGRGTINVSGGLYKQGTAYTNPDYVFEHFYEGEIIKFADKDGASDYPGLLSLEELQNFTRRHHRLPLMAMHEDGDLFDRGNLLYATVEQAYLYIFALEQRLKAIESVQIDENAEVRVPLKSA